jgi:sugar O-acyltransferase (sialic acid O-acetyltransferase NeuD family)
MKMFIYCAGGFGKEVYDAAKRANQVHQKWDAIYFIDDYATSGSDCYGTKVYTLDAVHEQFDPVDVEVVIANGEPLYRKRIHDKLIGKHFRLGAVIDSTAVISDTCVMAEGVIVTPFCSVSSLATVGVNVAVNTKSIVGHDVQLGDHCVVSSMVNIGGACKIGDSSYLGMGAQIKEGVRIGREVIVGMGSVVYNDIPDGMIALGNPARPMRQNVDKLVFRKT